MTNPHQNLAYFLKGRCPMIEKVAVRHVFLLQCLTGENFINFNYRTNLSEMKDKVWWGRN